MTGKAPAAAGKDGRRASFPVARIAGIEIRVHFTFLLLLALFAWLGPSAGFGSAWLAVAWLLVIFGCVVLHELAHCVVARRRGAAVHEILLFPLGGVSKLEHLPENPTDELAIAIVGPLASFAIATAAGLACFATGRALVPVDLVHGAWLARLTWLNLLLGAFNLLPAFPLDGGRVFRALLERRMDLETATRVALRVGHGFAVALVAAGLVFDFWLVLIGLFVYFGASAEASATIVHLRLRGHLVREVMRSDITQVRPAPDPGLGWVAPDDALADEVIAAVADSPTHQLAVVDAGRVVGVLQLEDLDRFVQAVPPSTNADPTTGA